MSTNHPIAVYAAKAKDVNNQYTSSSGGGFATIAEYAINNGYKVYGATYSKDFTGVYHSAAQTTEDSIKFRGSKYVQSDTLGTYKEVERALKAGNKVVYSGVACQIQGLRNYLRRDYDTLLTVDILCHGVPSPLIFRDYIQCVVSKYGPIESINMKDKSNGWGKQAPKFVFVDKTTTIPAELSLFWNKIFYSRTILRPSCHACRFTTLARCSDITLGDYWGIEKHYPHFFDRNGVSLLFINSEKGELFFSQIKERFLLEKTSEKACLQPVLCEPTAPADWRASLWDIYHRMGFKHLIYVIWGIRMMSIWKLKINQYLRRPLLR